MNIEALEKYCKSNDIIVNTYQKMAEMMNKPNLGLKVKGFAARASKNGLKLICYDGNLPETEKYAVFAHEIGHHVLGHITSREHKQSADEVEADVFSAVLMALSVFSETREAAAVV